MTSKKRVRRKVATVSPPRWMKKDAGRGMENLDASDFDIDFDENPEVRAKLMHQWQLQRSLEIIVRAIVQGNPSSFAWAHDERTRVAMEAMMGIRNSVGRRVESDIDVLIRIAEAEWNDIQSKRIPRRSLDKLTKSVLQERAPRKTTELASHVVRLRDKYAEVRLELLEIVGNERHSAFEDKAKVARGVILNALQEMGVRVAAPAD